MERGPGGVSVHCVDLFYADLFPPILGGVAGGLLATLVLAFSSSRRVCGERDHAKLWTSAVAHACWLVPLFVVATVVAGLALVIRHRSYC
jgi:hypothetical protein